GQDAIVFFRRESRDAAAQTSPKLFGPALNGSGCTLRGGDDRQTLVEKVATGMFCPGLLGTGQWMRTNELTMLRQMLFHLGHDEGLGATGICNQSAGLALAGNRKNLRDNLINRSTENNHICSTGEDAKIAMPLVNTAQALSLCQLSRIATGPKNVAEL